MTTKQLYLIIWMLLGALILVVAAAVTDGVDVSRLVIGGVIGALGGAAYQLVRYGL